MKNRICELLGIEYPIIQGGMAWVATAELAAAVSNGGGLGLIAAGGAPADVVRDQIRKCRELTDKPFGVNVMLMSPFAEEVMNVIIEGYVIILNITFKIVRLVEMLQLLHKFHVVCGNDTVPGIVRKIFQDRL